MSYGVLMVCTANICRSPMAERLLRARAGAHSDLVVSSSGVRGLEGQPIDPDAGQALADLGIDPSGHVARWLTDEQVAGADLVLTAQTDHRDAVLRMVPLMMRSVFTVREFVRLAAAADLPSGPGVTRADRVLAVAHMRGNAEVPGPGADDLPDPIGQGLDVVRGTAAELAAATDVLLHVLTP